MSINAICDYVIKKKSDEVESADNFIILNVIVIKRDIYIYVCYVKTVMIAQKDFRYQSFNFWEKNLVLCWDRSEINVF